ncbi:MAG TPA: phosphatase PAP2 family protein [Steroidobacteraceae bacterium]
MARTESGFSRWGSLALVASTLLIVGCTGPSAVKPATAALAGYLSQEEVPDSMALVPAPPANGSAAFAQDEAVGKEARALRDTPRWTQAALDANLSFPEAADTFSCALGVPVTEHDSPRLYAMLRRMLLDAGHTTAAAKNHYARTRPFVTYSESTCSPGEESILRTNGSYPSGHTTIGWAWALVLTEAAPDRANAILARGRSFGESRLVCNVHWQSDILQGRFLGAALTARLHDNAAFHSDFEAAKGEIAAARAKGMKPTRDCSAEAAALSQKLKLVM